MIPTEGDTAPKTRHPSSLLNLSLVDQAFRDPTVRYVCRGVDARWMYATDIRASLTGFNPMASTVFYRAHSRVVPWMIDREGDTRLYNKSDELIGEVMFMVHDYLHAWAARWIAALCPESGYGTAPITRSNLEKFTFCHLLTEAVATVGLDYWYVCTLDVNKELDLGTDLSHFTVSYRENYEPEYRRFFPGFTAQRPDYLSDITRFYCTGDFFGFGKEDMERSPLLLKWLGHELEYGETQREYSRSWLAYLSNEKIVLSAAQLKAPVAVDEAWQATLIGQVSELLWSKVKRNQLELPPAWGGGHGWKASGKKPCDFRFLNWNALQKAPNFGKLNLNLEDEDNFRHWYRQFLAQYDHEKLDKEVFAIRTDLLARRRRDLCEYFFRHQARVAADPGEPVDLFMLS